jgi:hypothetical protein
MKAKGASRMAKITVEFPNEGVYQNAITYLNRAQIVGAEWEAFGQVRLAMGTAKKEGDAAGE